jgi:hypothetical protein
MAITVNLRYTGKNGASRHTNDKIPEQDKAFIRK